MVGEGWVSAGTGSQSTVEVTTKIKTAEQELETAAQDLTELSGTLEGAKLAAEDAQVTAAGAKAALRDHDAQVSAWKRDHQRLLSQVETSQKEHGKLAERATELEDRKSTRLNSSHVAISYAVFCLKKKKAKKTACTDVVGRQE